MVKELEKQLDEYIEILNKYYNSDGTYNIDESGNGVVSISMTDECDEVELPVESFLDYMKDLRSLKKVDKSTVRTNHIRQTIINATRLGYDYVDTQLSKFVYNGVNYQARVIDHPFLIGLQNAKDFNCDDNYCLCPCSGYYALEIRYSDNNKLSKKEEDNLIRQILFDLTLRIGGAVFISQFIDINELTYYEDLGDSVASSKSLEIAIDPASLPRSYEMMDLYRQAKEILNPELAFLHYYKIIEYVSPAVAKKKAIELIEEQLNQPATVARDYQYMDSILNIASGYKDDQKDDYLMNNVIQECLDVKPELHHLPKVLLRQIRKNLSLEVDDDLSSVILSVDREKSLKRQVASILYSTRNSIVHAKANYTPTGWECAKDCLEEVNMMMDSFALKMIDWNEAQPETIKV